MPFLRRQPYELPFLGISFTRRGMWLQAQAATANLFGNGAWFQPFAPLGLGSCISDEISLKEQKRIKNGGKAGDFPFGESQTPKTLLQLGKVGQSKPPLPKGVLQVLRWKINPDRAGLHRAGWRTKRLVMMTANGSAPTERYLCCSPAFSFHSIAHSNLDGIQPTLSATSRA